MRIRLDRVVTLPTDERALGVPRCCCKATRRRQALDAVHVRHADLVDQAPRVGCDGFEVAPLGFCVKRGEGQRRLAGARHAGKHHQGIAGDVHVDILEVVFAGATHPDETGALRQVSG